jgi:copper(I)-binding protein
MHTVRQAIPALAIVLGTVSCRPSMGSSGTMGDIAVSAAAVSAPPEGAPAPAFFRIENHGAVPDTLFHIASPDADSVRLHQVTGGQMQPVPLLAVPAGGAVRLHPGSYHLMLEGLHRSLAVGDTVTLVLSFTRAGDLRFKVPVLRYSDAVGS